VRLGPSGALGDEGPCFAFGVVQLAAHHRDPHDADARLCVRGVAGDDLAIGRQRVVDLSGRLVGACAADRVIGHGT
jgi:hypothetical protein